MITKLTIHLTVEHNGSTPMKELADIIEMAFEERNSDIIDNPDDFGVTKYIVDSIFIE